jgi:hypothetical protein
MLFRYFEEILCFITGISYVLGTKLTFYIETGSDIHNAVVHGGFCLSVITKTENLLHDIYNLNIVLG